jgi:hypothetical protein
MLLGTCQSDVFSSEFRYLISMPAHAIRENNVDTQDRPQARLLERLNLYYHLLVELQYVPVNADIHSVPIPLEDCVRRKNAFLFSARVRLSNLLTCAGVEGKIVDARGFQSASARLLTSATEASEYDEHKLVARSRVFN